MQWIYAMICTSISLNLYFNFLFRIQWECQRMHPWLLLTSDIMIFSSLFPVALYLKLWHLLIIREIQIKTTMKYHFTLVRMAVTKISTNNKCWKRCEEKGTLFQCCTCFKTSIVSFRLHSSWWCSSSNHSQSLQKQWNPQKLYIHTRSVSQQP